MIKMIESPLSCQTPSADSLMTLTDNPLRVRIETLKSLIHRIAYPTILTLVELSALKLFNGILHILK